MGVNFRRHTPIWEESHSRQMTRQMELQAAGRVPMACRMEGWMA